MQLTSSYRCSHLWGWVASFCWSFDCFLHLLPTKPLALGWKAKAGTFCLPAYSAWQTKVLHPNLSTHTGRAFYPLYRGPQEPDPSLSLSYKTSSSSSDTHKHPWVPCAPDVQTRPVYGDCFRAARGATWLLWAVELPCTTASASSGMRRQAWERSLQTPRWCTKLQGNQVFVCLFK